MRVGNGGGWSQNPKDEREKESQWLDPAFAARLERRHRELQRLIETECSKGNKYMIKLKQKYEKEMKKKEANHENYMKKLAELESTKKKKPAEPIPSFALRWDPEHQEILAEKYVQYCNIGTSKFSTTDKMSGSRFFSFARHCGFVDEVKTSKIIATIKAKAKEARRRRRMPLTPAEIIEKQRVYTGPGAVTPATIDILFTKVQRKNKYPTKVINFDGFCEMVERLAIEVFGGSPEECRAKAIDVIKNVKVILTGTKPKKVDFHDDKNLYTGVWKRGGPRQLSTVVTLCNMMDRSPADVRGVNLYYSQHKLNPFPIRRHGTR